LARTEDRMMNLGDAAGKVSSFPVYPTLSSSIDRLLGGFRAGKLVEVYGQSNSGKTQLAMQTAMSVAHGGFHSLFVDTEGSFRPERVEEMAEQRGWDSRQMLNRIVYTRATDSTKQIGVIRRLGESKETSQCRFVVIDTLTKNFTLDYPGSPNMPRRQGTLGVHLSEIARDAFLNGRAYLLANRVTFSQEKQEVHIGGLTLSQMVHSSMHLEREGDRIRATVSGKPGASEWLHIGAAGLD
jgi:RecA/RadA recombinase